jgi:hypothetical protein
MEIRMSWKVEKYGDKPDVYALHDPAGGVAASGTKEQMDAALVKVQPPTPKIEQEATLSGTKDFAVGDTVVVVFWRTFMVMEQDKGGWETVHGTVVSIGATKVCHEVSKSFPPSMGGDVEANDGSSLRFRSKEWCFHSDEAAKKAIEKLPLKRK